jgi:hypothetical protein
LGFDPILIIKVEFFPGADRQLQLQQLTVICRHQEVDFNYEFLFLFFLLLTQRALVPREAQETVRQAQLRLRDVLLQIAEHERAFLSVVGCVAQDGVLDYLQAVRVQVFRWV